MYVYLFAARTRFSGAEQIAPAPLDCRNQINIDFPFIDLLRVYSFSIYLSPSTSLSHPLSTSFVSVVNNKVHVLTVRHGINHSLIGKSQRANTVARDRQIHGSSKSVAVT